MTNDQDVRDGLTLFYDRIERALSPELVSIIAELESLKALAYAKLSRPAPEPTAQSDAGEDRLLTVAQAAEILGVSERWVRDHQADLGRVELPGRLVRFSEKRLRTKMKRWSYTG